MRELDAKLESVGSRLMCLPSDDKLPFRLSEDDQKTIAVGSIMKVMVVNHSMVHYTQRKQIRSKIEPPGGWGVWIGNYKRGVGWNAEWLSRPFPMIRDDILARRRSKVAINQYVDSPTYFS
jgi:hypothetical protein